MDEAKKIWEEIETELKKKSKKTPKSTILAAVAKKYGIGIYFLRSAYKKAKNQEKENSKEGLELSGLEYFGRLLGFKSFGSRLRFPTVPSLPKQLDQEEGKGRSRSKIKVGVSERLDHEECRTLCGRVYLAALKGEAPELVLRRTAEEEGFDLVSLTRLYARFLSQLSWTRCYVLYLAKSSSNNGGGIDLAKVAQEKGFPQEVLEGVLRDPSSIQFPSPFLLW